MGRPEFVAARSGLLDAVNDNYGNYGAVFFYFDLQSNRRQTWTNQKWAGRDGQAQLMQCTLYREGADCKGTMVKEGHSGQIYCEGFSQGRGDASPERLHPVSTLKTPRHPISLPRFPVIRLP